MKNKICFIACYPELAALANEVKKEQSLPFDVVVGNLEEGVRQALEAEKKAPRSLSAGEGQPP